MKNNQGKDTLVEDAFPMDNISSALQSAWFPVPPAENLSPTGLQGNHEFSRSVDVDTGNVLTQDSLKNFIAGKAQ
jgi:hypothetical protein